MHYGEQANSRLTPICNVFISEALAEVGTNHWGIPQHPEHVSQDAVPALR
jgi:hypothetical protein